MDIDVTMLDLEELDKKARAEEDERIRAKISPPGSLGLPPLLDIRRIQLRIVDSYFQRRALYDRILIFQIAPEFARKKTFGDTSIVMPEDTADRHTKDTPRGVVISAGLRALDAMRANGVDLGHVVQFARMSPYRIIVDVVNAKEQAAIVARVGDLIASEDLAQSIREGLTRVEYNEETRQHHFVDEGGMVWAQNDPIPTEEDR